MNLFSSALEQTMACSMGVGCGGYFTPALREYLPYRNLRAAAPFGTQSYLPKECI